MFKTIAKPLTLASLLMWAGTLYAEIIPATIHGEIRDADNGSLVCALVMINGNYQTYSCSADGANEGVPFSLDYAYMTDSSDPSANKLLVFADQYKNVTMEIAQPDDTMIVEITKMEQNLLFDTLIGDWSVWYSDRGKFTESLPNDDCYLPCGPFQITRDDGSIVKGTLTTWNGPDTGATYTLTATYRDSRTWNWTIERESIPPGNYAGSCTETGTMAKIAGDNMLSVTSDDSNDCWGGKKSEYWIRYSR